MEYDSHQERLPVPQDEEDVNPFASPQMPCGRVDGVWRDGNEMVMICRGAVVPKACCLTNREDDLQRCREAMFGRFWTRLGRIAFWLPGSVILLAYYPIIPGDVATLKLWLHRRKCEWHLLLTCAGWSAYALGNSLTALSLMESEWGAAVICYLVTALAYVSLRIAERLKPVKPRAIDGLIRIRGIHPDYLARLDDFTTREANN